MASKEEKAREAARPYVLREGMVRKGGLNPDVSRITVCPDPLAPLGSMDGVCPAAASEKPDQEVPEVGEESPASSGESSD